MIQDIHSAEWIQVKEFTESRLTEMREQNDSPALNSEETAELRGRIAFAKEILALGKKAEQRPEIADTSYID